MEDTITNPMLISEKENLNRSMNKLPESPRLRPMEFLSRSWSLPALQLSKALSHSLLSFVSSATSQLVLERIISQSVSSHGKINYQININAHLPSFWVL